MQLEKLWEGLRLGFKFSPRKKTDPPFAPVPPFAPAASGGVGTYPSSEPRSTSSAAAAALRKRTASNGASAIASSSTGAPPRALFAALAEPPRLAATPALPVL